MSVSGSGRMIWQPKAVGETVSLPFDFTSMLAAGETISTVVVTASVYSGTDATPSSLISGSASASGAVASQSIIGGISGVIYWLLCKITTSASQTRELGGYLAVISDGAA